MKFQINRLFAIAAVGLFSVVASALPAAAQARIEGHFTLSHEVRWQNATLPAGDYKFSLPSATMTSPMFVTGPNGTIIEVTHVISFEQNNRPSVMTLEQRGRDYYVSELDLSEVGVQIRYNVPKQSSSNNKLLAQGPATEQVLVAMVKK
jgi:hypothetical protein